MVPHIDAIRPADVLAGRQGMPPGTFLHHLPSGAWPLFVRAWGSDARMHTRDTVLPIRPDDQHVHIILGGCVSQERFLAGREDKGPKVTRFRSAGQILSEGKLIELPAMVRTTCLTDTWIMPCSVDRMNMLLRKNPDIQKALLRSLETRNRTDELIYGTISRTPAQRVAPPVQRVAGLLYHLARTAGVAGTPEAGAVTVAGPSQQHLADSLQMGVSTVENALRRLREIPEEDGSSATRVLVLSKYRRFVVMDLPALHAFARLPEHFGAF
ncbi:Crp/Fnr family transcriptional regulator [Streptomyces sp. C1-2]|uniref:Crp/Fnr family transcriptional regulator n=1 Tax=Streptomyces sp. C1-2 TaxID=2720022 RepID=UPI001432697B|nr:Crp/Fnr family transcriptional regulator [Streptomyces sp. C1-2]NJP69523.1 Crp/Fnr family transcriptional regulator [Streptomyces sp. C1-2]